MLVRSSNLYSVDYDGASASLTIQFRNGRGYQYYRVPFDEFRSLVGASSVGSYFHAHINGRYEYRQIY